jgi:type II secretory pathway component GspD/PulD (secretin)
MHCSSLRQPVAILLCGLMACAGGWAQNPATATSTRDEQRAMTKPDPKLAKKYAEIGARAEAARDYEKALDAYEQAARYAPFDVTLVGKAAALRGKLVRGYVDDGERLAVEGNLDGAARNYALALHVDPSNAVLMERMKQMESMKEDEKEPADEPAQGLPQLDFQKVIKSFNLRTDLRSAYEQVAAAYGIKAAFDPDLASRNVRLRLDNVDFETAMKILPLETGTFWRPLNTRLLFVAADTQEKRKAFEMEIEQSFALPASVDSNEITELVRAVRELTGVQHIQQSVPSHTITIRDTVPRVKLAGAIIRQMEQARGEVLLEVEFVEVDRNTAVNLGITPSSSVQLVTLSPSLADQVRSAQSVTALLTILASIFGTPASGAAVTSLSSAIPGLIALGGGKSTFLLTLPSASAEFSQALSLVHSTSQVLLRAQDGKPATFFVGDRYPVTLSLLSASIGSNGSAATSISAGATGTGTSISEQTFTVGQGPVALVSADFLNAGTEDLAVVNQIDNTLSILLNQGTGAVAQFAAATGSPITLGTARTSAPTIPASLATGTINTSVNSFPGLLVTDPVGNTVSVLTGNGDGTFALFKNTIAVGNQPSAIVTGTFNTNNGDSNTGFVVTNFKDNTISVFNGLGNGTFTQVKGSPFALPDSVTGPIAITSADFNGDGLPDLAIVDQGTNQITVLKGNGNGTFTEFPKSPISVGKFPVAIASGSLNGSTGPGLGVVNQDDNSVTILLGNGDGTFSYATNSPLTTDTKPTGIVIGNFLGQSYDGVAVTNSEYGTNADLGSVTVYVDLGSGLLQALEQQVDANPVAIVAGSFTGSSFPDIAVANNFSGSAGQVTLIVSPTSLISGGAGAVQQPYPGSEYIDIGTKVKATPSLHPDKEVTLALDFDIKSLSGNSVNGIPIIASQTLTQNVRLKEDETSLLTGLLNQQVTNTITGIPGLAPLPVVGYFFGGRDKTYADTELLVLITPRRVRQPVRESKTIYAGRGDATGRGSTGVSAPFAPPPTPAPEPAPAPEPTPAPAQPPVTEPPTNEPPAQAPQPAPEPAPNQNEQPNNPPGQPPPQPEQGQPPPQSR